VFQNIKKSNYRCAPVSQWESGEFGPYNSASTTMHTRCGEPDAVLVGIEADHITEWPHLTNPAASSHAAVHQQVFWTEFKKTGNPEFCNFPFAFVEPMIPVYCVQALELNGFHCCLLLPPSI
jgi:hypothetical protein